MSKVKAHQIYRVADGTPVPGATTVLGVLAKPALVPWANKLGFLQIDSGKYIREMGLIGSLGHLLITDKLEGKHTDTSDYSKNQIDQAENSVLSFWEWERTNRIQEVIFCERQLVSELHRYGGTVDIYARIDDKLNLIDLKTGNGIYAEHGYQCAAYRHLLVANGCPVDVVRVVNIPRAETEAFDQKVLTAEEIDRGFQIFLACLKIYNLRKGEKKPWQKKTS